LNILKIQYINIRLINISDLIDTSSQNTHPFYCGKRKYEPNEGPTPSRALNRSYYGYFLQKVFKFSNFSYIQHVNKILINTSLIFHQQIRIICERIKY